MCYFSYLQYWRQLDRETCEKEYHRSRHSLLPDTKKLRGLSWGRRFCLHLKKEKKDRLLSGFAIFLFVPTNYEVNTLSESTWPRHKTVAATHQGRPRIEHTPIMIPTHSISKWYPQLKQIHIFPINFTRSEYFLLWFYRGCVHSTYARFWQLFTQPPPCTHYDICHC